MSDLYDDCDNPQADACNALDCDDEYGDECGEVDVEPVAGLGDAPDLGDEDGAAK